LQFGGFCNSVPSVLREKGPPEESFTQYLHLLLDQPLHSFQVAVKRFELFAEGFFQLFGNSGIHTHALDLQVPY